MAYCFSPAGSEHFPARRWEPGERVPVLERMPAGHRVIGHFRAYDACSMNFLEEAMDYHAKRVGADAIVMQKYQVQHRKEFVSDSVCRERKWVEPTKEEWKAYNQWPYEFKLGQGDYSRPPAMPTRQSVVVSEKPIPAHWAIREQHASVEAAFVRRNP
jgi:hypothetical protein